MHFCCSHYISPCFLSTPPFILSLSLSLSPPSFSLWLQDTCHLMPFTKYSLLDQSYFFHTISFHSSYKIHQLFTDYLLRLPSELLKKRVFSLSGQPSSSFEPVGFFRIGPEKSPASKQHRSAWFGFSLWAQGFRLAWSWSAVGVCAFWIFCFVWL